MDAVTMIGFGSGGHVGLDNVANFISAATVVADIIEEAGDLLDRLNGIAR